MVSLETPACEFDKDAINFSLPGVDGNTGRLKIVPEIKACW